MDSGLKYDWFLGIPCQDDSTGEMFYWIESTVEPEVMRRSTLRSLQNLAANVGEEWDISRKLDQMP